MQHNQNTKLRTKAEFDDFLKDMLFGANAAEEVRNGMKHGQQERNRQKYEFMQSSPSKFVEQVR